MPNNNKHLAYLIHEVQTVLNCSEDDALGVVSSINSLGGDPVEFIYRLPGIVGTTTPNVAELKETLNTLVAQSGGNAYSVCFPKGYQNRKARRKSKKHKN